jgi:hypothetical protein
MNRDLHFMSLYAWPAKDATGNMEAILESDWDRMSRWRVAGSSG